MSVSCSARTHEKEGREARGIERFSAAMAHEDHTAPAVSQPEAEPEPTPQVDFNNIMHPPREPRSQRVIGFMPNWIKNEIVAMMAEFAGTTMFLLFAFGGTNVANAPAASAGATTVTATGADTSQLLYISLCFGFSLTVNACVHFMGTFSRPCLMMIVGCFSEFLVACSIQQSVSRWL